MVLDDAAAADGEFVSTISDKHHHQNTSSSTSSTVIAVCILTG